MPLIQAQVIQERVPASAVRHERLTMEHPWPFFASQQSRERGSSVSSNSPQRFLLWGTCWVCKDKKTEVPEGRVSSKVLGCQRNEYIKWLWKKRWKRSTLQAPGRSDCPSDLDRSQGRDNFALELPALRARFQETYQGRLTWMGTNELMTQIQEQVRL